ncbi:MAG: altronate dehydratase [Chitinophagaceae bacterium]|nr:MAG: altronate dehydratase [Chitinophagaceae bacterium]
MKKYLQIHSDDNILVALTDLSKGEEISYKGEQFPLTDNIRQKHKFAIKPFESGDKIIMYGVLVGKAAKAIPKGGSISTENVKHASGSFDGRTKEFHWQAPDVSKWKNTTFMGYHRSDGQVGTRNFWLVIPMVFCENRNVNVMKEAMLKELGYAQPEVYRNAVKELVEAYKSGDNEYLIRSLETPEKTAVEPQRRIFENIDGIKFLLHEGGCGCSREDSDNLCALLAGYCNNPNVVGITILSLGCQHAQVSILQEEIKKRNPDFDKPFLVFEQQKWHSEYKMLTQAMRKTFLGMMEVNQLKRRPAPLSKLMVGVKCGGSDGFSGISANPAVGHFADLLVALGGKIVLAEFPELCGVEQELIDRSVSDEVADRFGKLMREYAKRADAVGADFSMNPSPGNVRDGLITDAMKSAGAARKGGTSPVVGALGYPEYATQPGLNLLCTPGNDVEATTGMAGAGCTVQLFTTGLGTPTGNPVSTVVKIATNSELARRMPDIIDINAGTIITGNKTVEEVGEEILEYVIHLANGEFDTKATQLGQDDFIPWKKGISL